MHPDLTAPSANDGPDPWRLAGLPGGLALASYLTAGSNSVQYRLVVEVLLDQQQHALTGVLHDDLAKLLRARISRSAGDATADRLLTDFPLADRMAQLHRWRVVDTWDERPVRDEDFLRNGARYQLTPMAAEFHRAVTSLGATNAASIAAALAPGSLRDAVATMRTNLGTDAQLVAQSWSQVRTTLEAMAKASQAWMSDLAGALAGATDASKVELLQNTLLRYADMWGSHVDQHGEQLTSDAESMLESMPGAPWRAAALTAVGAEADDDTVADMVENYRATLRQVVAWFGPGESQARQLRLNMRNAIAPMIRGQRTLASVGGHISRRADLLTLAGALESSPDDDTAWALWAKATGLFSARHLGLPSPQPGGSAGATSFWEAEPALVEQRLRKQGPRSQSGRPARIADRSAGRAAARAAATVVRLAAAQTRAVILDRSGRPLSQWGALDHAQLEVLLTMLAAVAGVPPDGDGIQHATTGDGRWLLQARRPDPGVPSAVLHTARGRLVHPDIKLSVRSADTIFGAPATAWFDPTPTNDGQVT